MEKEVRCSKCNRMLGKTGADYKIDAQINAATCEDEGIVFSVKCPRCGEIEQIVFKR